MVTLAQRIEQLRSQQGLTRPALAAALGMPRNAIEKFETGRQTPTKDQQNKLATYFGVSLAYLQGESDDPTSMSNWMTTALSGAEPDPDPVPVRRTAPASKAKPASDGGSSGGVLAALLSNKAFHDTLRAEILEVLRTKEGQDLLADIVRKEINKQK
jgi:transcriptional regulator with XRE-family HTH domain